jgi:hypothetical protein
MKLDYQLESTLFAGAAVTNRGLVSVPRSNQCNNILTCIGFDDADFNMHMSNSSYAKALDPARICFAVDTFPNLFRAGGWIPLAGAFAIYLVRVSLICAPATHYHFLHEIPIFTRYEIRTTIGAWDDKWVSLVELPLPLFMRAAHYFIFFRFTLLYPTLFSYSLAY